ncbi:MAG: T9SS type A sorting domain-containing protein [Flavobacterium sp.]|nr:T9SS type A sorting domain-containing protein [Flavobacterium sp.]
MRIKKLLFSAFILALAPVNAQYGVLDQTFNPGAGADASIQVVAVQGDGKILIGGDFQTFDGVNKKRFARLNSDGSLDSEFQIGTGANNSVMSILVQPDQKIIVGGMFSVFNNTAQKRIMRLNSDGTIDSTWNPGFGANNDVLCSYLLPDGKILIGGTFTSYNWIARNGIARLNEDGSLDESFNPTAPITMVNEITFLSDGKMLVNAGTKLIKLASDGTTDETFQTGTGTDYPIQAVHEQPSGKIIIGGYFNVYNDQPQNRFLRLNADGSVDDTFITTGANYGVLTITEQEDGHLLISGLFSTYNNAPAQKVARITPDGLLDLTFNPGNGPDSIVLHHVVQPNGSVVLVGDFLSYNGVERGRIARISGHLPLSTNQFVANQNITVFPNPASQNLNVSLPENMVASSFAILTLTGKSIANFDSSSTSFTVDSLPNGFYILQTNTDDHSYFTKFVKN